MIYICMKDRSGRIYGTFTPPHDWTLRDLKEWLDLMNKHSKIKGMAAYWKVSRSNDRRYRRDST